MSGELWIWNKTRMNGVIFQHAMNYSYASFHEGKSGITQQFITQTICDTNNWNRYSSTMLTRKKVDEKMKTTQLYIFIV